MRLQHLAAQFNPVQPTVSPATCALRIAIAQLSWSQQPTQGMEVLGCHGYAVKDSFITDKKVLWSEKKQKNCLLVCKIKVPEEVIVAEKTIPS